VTRFQALSYSLGGEYMTKLVRNCQELMRIKMHSWTTVSAPSAQVHVRGPGRDTFPTLVDPAHTPQGVRLIQEQEHRRSTPRNATEPGDAAAGDGPGTGLGSAPRQLDRGVGDFRGPLEWGPEIGDRGASVHCQSHDAGVALLV